jgi:nucleotide-binding universal stress UspA family protein
MKKILIPTDFSDISKNAVIFAFHMAEKLNVEIELIHVLEIYKFAAGTSEAELISTILPAENIAEMESSAKESFETFMQSIIPLVPSSVKYNINIVTGHLINEMAVRSAMPETDLIVLGVSCTQDLVTRFTHSTISSILLESQCPVLIIPSCYLYAPFGKVIVPVDFQETEIKMIEYFLSTFQGFNPQIKIIHVTRSIDFDVELKMTGMKHLIEERTSYKEISYQLIIHKNIVQGILEQVKDANLLLMLKENEGFIKSLFESSKTEKITHYLRIPMLSYR